MDMISFNMMNCALTYIGALCIACLCVALIVWAIRTIIRNIVETKYAISVKYYIQDTHNRIVDYDRRVRSVETEMSEIKKQLKGGRHET